MLDVLIVTSLSTEHDAVRAVNTGAVADSAWESRLGPAGLELSVRAFRSFDGGALKVGLVQVASASVGVAAVATMLAQFQDVPQCIVLCGVCAGRVGAVSSGDVIFADRVTAAGTAPSGDAPLWNLDAHWASAAPRFLVPTDAPWLRDRPLPIEAQADWLLWCVASGVDPRQSPERAARCPDWKTVILWLRGRGLLADHGFKLTPTGEAAADDLYVLHPDGAPEAPPWRVHVGPLVARDRVAPPEAWPSRFGPDLGLEVEGALLTSLPLLVAQGRCLVVRGVADVAEGVMHDRGLAFAARAAAECALAFVCDRLGAVSLDDVLDPGVAELPANPPPSALLQARHRVSPFYGRAEVLARLTDWCNTGDPVRLYLVHAEGGMGKTRLAIELCERMRHAGWVAGFLREPAPPRWFERLWQSERPALVVIDYAESRTTLPALLEPVAQHQRGWKRAPFRVLLLARSASDWWENLRSRAESLRDLLGFTGMEYLPALTATVEERMDLLREAVPAFARVRRRAVRAEALPDVADARFKRVLYLQMAALAHVDGLPAGADQLMDAVLDHEERFWGEARVDAARWVMLAATLRGGLRDEAEAFAVAERACQAPQAELVRWLRGVYPVGSARAQEPVYVAALEPDLLAEAMILRTLQRGTNDPAAWLDWVLADNAPPALQHAFEALGALSIEHAKVVSPWMRALLERGLEVRAPEALRAALALGRKTIDASLGDVLADVLERHGTPAVAELLGRVGMPDQTITLQRVALWVARQRSELQTEAKGVAEQLRRVDRLVDLSGRLASHGDHEGALARACSAEALARRLVQQDSSETSQSLARSLDMLGICLGALGRREDALKATQEAVDLRRTLAERNPDAFLPALATSLSNLGVDLGDLGRREDALKAAQEAVDLCRTLPARNPDAFLPDLAMSLINLGHSLGALGSREDALKATQEAVDQYRTLAARNPDAFLPDFATSLNNLGVHLGGLGRWEDALKAVQEAVDLCRTLAARNPDAFLPGFARSLNNLGAHLGGLGRREDALKAVQEAVDLRRTLAERNPDTFLPDLAMSLDNLGIRLGALGRREDALKATQEAVEQYRSLAARNPDAFLPSFARSLDNLGIRLGALGRREDALKVVQEAVDLRRTLAARNPDAFLPNLAWSLNNLALRLNELGRAREALPFAQEALDVLWPFYERLPAAHGPDVRWVLGTLADLFKALGKAPDKSWKQRMTRYVALSGS